MFKTFALGGIHPEENKISAGQPIENLPVPEKVVIPLSQNIGAPAKPIVTKGDRIKTGQLIAKSIGFISANIHSSVSGKVIKIDLILNITGFKQPAIVINVEGNEWMDEIDLSNELKTDFDLTPHEIRKRVHDAGIVGLGGATFPSHVKLTLPKDETAEYLIVNGSECEPYLTSDHSLMLEKSEEILVGVRIIMKALNVNKAFIGIENNKQDAIDKLQKVAKNYNGIEVQPLKVKYPQGGEKQLIQAIINREVPSGGLPVNIGVVVFNVATLFAVYEAIQKNKPLIERIVAISGKHLKKPSNFRTRIGTPISELIKAVGGLPENTGKVIAGGPMMGKALNITDVPVVKGTTGVVLIPEEDSLRKPVLNCIRCSRCITTCPMGLEPYLLMALTEKEKYDWLEENKAMDCIECGSCSYICPAHRPLLDLIRLGKAQVHRIRRSRKE